MTNIVQKFSTEDISINTKDRLYKESIWLNQGEIAGLYGKTSNNISKHINNIYKEGELEKSQVEAKSTKSGKGLSKPITYYNLTMFIHLGYRIKSKKAIEFRKWATSVLKKEIEAQQKRSLSVVELLMLNVEKIKELEKTVEEQKPAVEFANKFEKVKGNITIGNFAKIHEKETGINYQKMYRILREIKVIDRNNIARSRYSNSSYGAGYFVNRPWQKNERTGMTSYITPKGQTWLLKKLDKEVL